MALPAMTKEKYRLFNQQIPILAATWTMDRSNKQWRLTQEHNAWSFLPETVNINVYKAMCSQIIQK
jgi:hypothetical protein